MEDYQQRVIEEHKELCAKAVKLYEFINTEAYTQLDSDERQLLNQQYLAMMSYANILQKRINRFK